CVRSPRDTERSSTRRSDCRTRRRTTSSAMASTRTTCSSPARSPTSRHRTRATRSHSAPSSNTCRLLARDHAAPEPTLALAKAASVGRERVRPLAWCSRPRNSAALLEAALVAHPAIHAGFWPAITRRQSPPSLLPRLPALAASECGLWLGARDPETRRPYWKGY